MPDNVGAVGCLFHGAEEEHVEHALLGAAPDGFDEGLEVDRILCVGKEELESEGAGDVGVGFHFLHVRGVVNAVEKERFGVGQRQGGDGVGEEHGLFHHAVGFVTGAADNAHGFAGVVEDDPGFGDIEVERPALHVETNEDIGQIGEGVERFAHFGRDIAGRAVEFAVDEILRLFVGETGVGMDDRVGDLAGNDRAFAVELREHALGETVLVRAQTAQFVGEALGEHGNDPVHQVAAHAALAGFEIGHGAVGNIVGNIGDVHADIEAAVFATRDGNGVIEIAGVRGIDGERDHAPDIAAPGDDPLVEIGGNLPRLIDNLRRETHGEGVAFDDDEHIHARSIGRPEDLHDGAGGMGVGRSLRFRAADHQVAFVGLQFLAAHDQHVLDVDILLGRDIGSLANPVVDADDGSGCALHDFHHLARFVQPEMTLADETHLHDISGERPRGVVTVNEDGFPSLGTHESAAVPRWEEGADNDATG